MNESEIIELSNNIDFSSGNLNNFGNNILLTNSEVSVLDKYNINYRSCLSLGEVIFKIENYLDEFEYNLEDLDNVCLSISERNYYMNTNK